MVCFKLEIAVPKMKRQCNNIALESRMKHLLKHYNADYSKLKETAEFTHYKVLVCDEETVSLLRDFPQPFGVTTITLLRTGENLYTFKQHHQPPPNPLLRDVYWMAKSTEKWW
jgi:hypothetical protein